MQNAPLYAASNQMQRRDAGLVLASHLPRMDWSQAEDQVSCDWWTSITILSSDWSAADPGRGLRLGRRDLQPPGAGGEEGAGRQAGAGAGGRQGGTLLTLELATNFREVVLC